MAKSLLAVERHGPLPESRQHEAFQAALRALAKLEQAELERPRWFPWR